ncbi:MAG: 2-C-methyl-D-erythritol 4-phosphate cytidylyltransferase [Bacillota bacterium]
MSRAAGRAPQGTVAAIIPAAGQGTRMGGGTAKQFLPLLGKPMLAHTLAAFEAATSITQVVLVVGSDLLDACRREIVERYGFRKVHGIVPGGKERQDSVYSGLRSLGPGYDLVMVHDAARPLVTPEILDRAVAEARGKGAVVAAVPVKDTIKVVDAGAVVETPERDRLWAAQTPQVFPYALLLEAHQAALEDGFMGTDDAALVERLGRPVHIVEGSPENLKITTPEDLMLAEAILSRR